MHFSVPAWLLMYKTPGDWTNGKSLFVLPDVVLRLNSSVGSGGWAISWGLDNGKHSNLGLGTVASTKMNLIRSTLRSGMVTKAYRKEKLHSCLL